MSKRRVFSNFFYVLIYATEGQYTFKIYLIIYMNGILRKLLLFTVKNSIYDCFDIFTNFITAIMNTQKVKLPKMTVTKSEMAKNESVTVKI